MSDPVNLIYPPLDGPSRIAHAALKCQEHANHWDTLCGECLPGNDFDSVVDSDMFGDWGVPDSQRCQKCSKSLGGLFDH